MESEMNPPITHDPAEPTGQVQKGPPVFPGSESVSIKKAQVRSRRGFRGQESQPGFVGKEFPWNLQRAAVGEGQALPVTGAPLPGVDDCGVSGQIEESVHTPSQGALEKGFSGHQALRQSQALSHRGVPSRDGWFQACHQEGGCEFVVGTPEEISQVDPGPRLNRTVQGRGEGSPRGHGRKTQDRSDGPASGTNRQAGQLRPLRQNGRRQEGLHGRAGGDPFQNGAPSPGGPLPNFGNGHDGSVGDSSKDHGPEIQWEIHFPLQECLQQSGELKALIRPDGEADVGVRRVSEPGW